MEDAEALSDGLLLERSGELAAFSGLLSRLSGPHGGLVVVEGPAGIGASTLLDALHAQATTGGTPVLRARGSELTREVPFGLVRRLLEPAVRARPELLSRGLAAVARPIFDGTLGVTTGGAAGPLAEGLVGLMARLVLPAGEPGGRLLIVDDAHWADPASLLFLAELAARTEELPVGVALALRLGEQPTDPGLIERLRHAAGDMLLRPAPLSDAAVAQLVAETLPDAVPGFAATVAAATGGNPTLVGAVLRRAAGRSGDASDGGDALDVGALVPERLAGSLLVTLERMGPGAHALAAAVAILEEGPLRRAAELAGLDAATAEATADALAARQLLDPGEPVRFMHPVVGAAIAGTLTPFERARLHRRAAELLAADDVDDATVAAHLLAARADDDPWAVEVLRRAARRALGGGDPIAAVRLLARAIAEPPQPELRGEVLVELAGAEAAAGAPGAIDRFESALLQVRDRGPRVEAWHGLSRLLLVRSDPAGAAAAAARGRAELPTGDPGHQRLLADELAAAALLPERAEEMARETDRLVVELRAGVAPTEPTLLAHLVMHLAWRGIDLHRVSELAHAAVAAEPLVDRETRGFAAAFATGALNWVDELEAGATLLDAAVARAAQLGDPVAEANVRSTRAWNAFFRGRLGETRRDLERIIGLDRLAWPMVVGLAAQPLALLRLELGDVAGAARALQQAEAAAQPGVNWVRGQVRLAERDPAGALEAFLAERAILEDGFGLGNPAVLSWRSGAAVAAHRLGDAGRARALVAEELDRARALGVSRSLGSTLRAAGVVADGRDAVAFLEESVAVLDGTAARLELARSLTELGAAYRRDRRAVDARPVLERALQAADGCGATALAARALAELQAAGARPRRRAVTGPGALTASERRVAELAAGGASTRAIADELVISPKTVETHLTRAYRKLGIRSRAELADGLAAHPPS